MAVLCVRCEFQINHAYVGIYGGKLGLGQGFISHSLPHRWPFVFDG